MQIFCIHDTKAESHLQPFFCENEAVALRLLSKPCRDENHSFCNNSEDYHLYQIGMYDENTGEIDAIQKRHITCLQALTIAGDIVEPQPSLSLMGGPVPQGGE